MNQDEIKRRLQLSPADIDLMALSMRWSAQSSRVSLCGLGKRFVHRIIAKRMGADPKELVQFINGDCLDLRRENLSTKSLRLASLSERWPNGMTDQAGVTICRRSGLYAVNLTHRGKTTFLGRFIDYESACNAYREMDAGIVRTGDRLCPSGWHTRAE